MSSIKCPQCGLINWATAITCKRCKFVFQPEALKALASQPSLQANYSDQNPFGENQTNKVNFQPVNQTQNNWSQNPPPPDTPAQKQHQSYQSQNFNQSHSDYYQPEKLKSGMAIASLMFGVLGFATVIFLVGLLFAPIGLTLGIMALMKANKKPLVYGSKGLAIAGITLSGIIILFVPIIVAIAVPNLLATRRAAKEASAIATLKTVAGAEAVYRASTVGKCGDIQTLIATGLIDVSLASNDKNGYRFMVINLPQGGCEIFATPLSGSRGSRSFYYSTEDGVIRAGAKKGLPADRSDFPLSGELPNRYKLPPKINSQNSNSF